MIGPDVTVQRLVAVDVPVHAEHAAPAGLVVRAAIVVVFVGATKKVSDVGGGVWFFSTDLLFFTQVQINLWWFCLRRGQQVNEWQNSSSSSCSSCLNKQNENLS